MSVQQWKPLRMWMVWPRAEEDDVAIEIWDAGSAKDDDGVVSALWYDAATDVVKSDRRPVSALLRWELPREGVAEGVASVY